MNKPILLFIVLFPCVSFADGYITPNMAPVCDTNTFVAVNGKTKLKPVFQPSVYNCASGYFLPANTTGCQPCPNGYTCNGGIFQFNESRASGITGPNKLTQDVSKICSSNILVAANNKTLLKPIFQPNTVNLTYDDGNGHTSSGTCTYDSLINLPPEPTRPGYTFTGWKLQTNNE